MNAASWSEYSILVCQNVACGLRYPVAVRSALGAACPKCGAKTRIAYRGQLEPENPMPWASSIGFELHVVLDNVRSSFNVGSIFRIADGAGVTRIHLCGYTPSPDNPKVAKTALGAQSSVGWTTYGSALDAAETLRAEGFWLWALECDEGCGSLFDHALPVGRRMALVAGNEISGIDPDLLDLCERVLHIPMDGVKGSLNVAVALGIAVYWLRAASQ